MSDCDYNDLIEEARVLLLAVPLDVRQSAGLLGKLRTCAHDANDAGDVTGEKILCAAADELERRLREE